MDFSILVPILFGFLFAIVINYFTDLLPHSFTLSRPVCHHQGCSRPFSWTGYLLLWRCENCQTRSRGRLVFVYILTLASSIYLWINQSSFLLYLLSLLVLSYLFIVGFIDFEHHLILLSLNIAGLFVLGCAGVILHGWLSTLIGCVAGAALMYLLFLLGKLFTRYKARKLDVPQSSLEDSLAFGDVILMALLGLLLGWPGVWLGLLLGILLAGILSIAIIFILTLQRKYREKALSFFIPLGPGFIIASITIVYIPQIFSSF